MEKLSDTYRRLAGGISEMSVFTFFQFFLLAAQVSQLAFSGV